MRWDLNRLMREVEICFINLAISQANNKAQAAKLLGLKRSTLLEKMKRYGMPLLPPNVAKNKSKIGERT